MKEYTNNWDIDYPKIVEDVSTIIKYNCDQSGFSDEFLKLWKYNKEYFYRAFGNKMIYNCGNIEIEMSQKEKEEYYEDFLSFLNARYSHENLLKLGEWLQKNVSANEFFNNKINSPKELPESGKIFQKGTRIIKLFKFFLDDKNELNYYQSVASELIQKGKIKGELCLSIHPLDFLSASENDNNWRSCHALNGEFCAGNLSYLVDPTTIICYIKNRDNVSLPNFGGIKWNSKVWRMWLYASEGRTCLFAGKQYPMSLGWTPLNKIKSLLPEQETWSAWHNDQLKSFVYDSDNGNPDPANNDDTLIPLKHKYININGYVYALNKIVKDMSKLHYNDVLLASENPFYLFKKTSRRIPSVKIGGEVPCPVCGNHLLEESDSLCCRCCKQEEFANY